MIGRGSFDPAIGRKVRGDRALVRELEQLAGGVGRMVHHEQRSWKSITFAGARYRMKWAFEGAEAVAGGELLIAALPDHDFAIPGQLVADAAVTAVDHLIEPPQLVVDVELLVLEEA